MTASNQDIISDNNGCLDFAMQCENNPIFKGISNSDTCNKGYTWAGGKLNGQKVADTCKKSCGKCGGMFDYFIPNMLCFQLMISLLSFR